MYDTALTPLTEEVTLPQLAPRSPSLTEHLIQLLSQVLELAPPTTRPCWMAPVVGGGLPPSRSRSWLSRY